MRPLIASLLAALLALAGLGLAACSSRTGVYVVVHTDMPPGELDRVVFRASTAGQEFTNAQAPWRIGANGPDQLPGSIVLLWGGSLDPMDLVLEGYAPGDSSPRVVRRARLSPSPGQLVLVRLALSGGCAGEGSPRCGSDEVCAAGSCVPLEVPDACITPYSADAELTVPCRSTPALVDSRTGEPVVTTGPGCAAGERCIEGCCLREGGAPADGGVDVDGPADAGEDRADLEPDVDPDGCPDNCTSCRDDGTCVIECGADECREDELSCPPGRPCQVTCRGENACENAHINCTDATACTIECIGSEACETGGINCSGGVCQVVCSGEGACEDGLVNCDADQCLIVCQGPGACAGGACCSGDDCGLRCQALNGGSCDCP